MSLHAAREMLSISEPCLLAATLYAFARGKGYRGFPAFGAYLVCRLGLCALLLGLLYSVRFSLVEKHLAYGVYYYVYWIGYLVGAGIALLLIQEIFRHLMQPLPGLGRYGLMAFRWVTLTSVMIALALAIYPSGQNRHPLVAATSGAMRCMSVLEICLLAFVLVSMQTLRLSPRSRQFGIALGLGLIAAADLFGSAFAFGQSSLASIAGLGTQVLVTLVCVLWTGYFLQTPVEDERVAASTAPWLQRWNEIADALSQSTPPQVALTSPDRFFLKDVERVVDRILEKNSINSAP
jgi:hypothetical protein